MGLISITLLPEPKFVRDGIGRRYVDYLGGLFAVNLAQECFYCRA